MRLHARSRLTLLTVAGMLAAAAPAMTLAAAVTSTISSGGVYTLTNVYSAKLLDVQNASTSPGAPVVQWHNNVGARQPRLPSRPPRGEQGRRDERGGGQAEVLGAAPPRPGETGAAAASAGPGPCLTTLFGGALFYALTIELLSLDDIGLDAPGAVAASCRPWRWPPPWGAWLFARLSGLPARVLFPAEFGGTALGLVTVFATSSVPSSRSAR
ncbi:RICIN domain-containing protein [Streptomyces sp. Li-HN-5-11]|uniref:RICIN domain-containing protein n=1 Tax=Streptomyces sp. Li-HN-5-11 TaxID=3075432 RepID=UPI0028A895E6|nr:RICIN domain-containing protein [Streptomyces sp. Li-HN-5-11]WNM32581.1 RICIN domain-containing protein [Streptomyces sp. Li-HN-5-11]